MVKESPSALPFVEVWRRAVFASNLTPATKVVAFGIAIHMNGDGTSTRAGPSRIAEETHLHRDTILRGRRILLEAGWLQIVTTGGTKRGGLRKANEYRGTISTRGESAPGAKRPPVANGLDPRGQKTLPPGGENTPQVRQESKAIEEEGSAAGFCGKCERGWLETPDGNFTRCQCIGGPIPSTNTTSLLEEIDELIAPPPPGLRRAERNGPYNADHEPF